MDRETLKNYIDACKLIKEIEEELEELKNKNNVHDKVSGSNPEFPYQKQSFSVYGNVIEKEYKEKQQFLLQQRARAIKVKESVEKWMNTIPIRMQRIIRYKIFDGLKWDEVGERMGELSGDNVRKEYYKFVKK